ncbi:MAG: exo-alpha-sialidase, partial [Acidobacteriota bacterium]|nr:exo-alpha-sialidase [Acidobacteriota bacterium]
MNNSARQRLVSRVNRFRTLIVFFCLFGVVAVALVLPLKHGASAASGPEAPPKVMPATFNQLLSGSLQTPSTFKPTVIAPVGSGVSQAVRDLPLTKTVVGPPWLGDSPRPIHPPHALPTLPVQDPVQQKSAATASMPAANQTFDGMSQSDACGNCIPPDPVGAVGPNHYVEMVNSSFAVYSKSGTKLSGPTDINSLFQGLPANAACRLYNDGDPVVVYDQLADRWVLTQFAVNGGSGPYDECVAVSSSSDPTGSYYVYDFHRSDTVFHDYPKLGVWPDGYYMTTNEFDGTTETFLGAGVAALERDKMLAGDAGARMIFFDLSTVNSSFGGMLPATLDGGTLPPAGSPNYVAEVDSQINSPTLGADAMRIWKFHADWANPSNSTFGADGLPDSTLPVAAWTPAQCIEGQGTCAPQEGSPYTLDILGDRLMFRLAYRNFGDHESLLLNHSVLADARVGVRWYEVRGLSTTPTIFQQSTFAPTDSLWRWMGSIAMDHSGDIAVAYSTSSPASFPSLAYAGRLNGDPAGELTQGEAQLFAGGGPENVAFFAPPVGRWGDYSSLTVDPTDDCTFWYVNEYFSPLAQQGTDAPGAPWRTRIGSFKFSQCVPSSVNPTPTPTPSATPTPTATPTPSPTPAPSENACFAPGVTVQTDDSGDQNGAPATSQLDLTSVRIAEPYVSDTDHSIVFTIKADNLSGGPQTNSTWAVFLNVADTNNTQQTIFFNMNTVDDPTGAVGFNYGYKSGNNTTSQGAGSVITGSYTADGVITLKVNTAGVLGFNDITGAHQFNVDLSKPGKKLTAIQGETDVFVGALGNGGSLSVDTTDKGSGEYTTVGNAACRPSTPTPTPTPSATPTATPTPTPSPTPIPTPSGPRYYNYAPEPAVGENAGEPSIGYNPASKRAMYIAGLQTLRVTFPENFNPPGSTPEAAPATWEDVSSIITRTRSLDPILFTDRNTGRTFASQLNSLSQTSATGVLVGLNSLMAYSDDDGATWTPAQVNPPDGSYDHQTVGAGPYPASLSALSNPLNKGDAVYYCAQAGLAAFCSRSDDGGLNFGRAMPVDTAVSSSAATGCEAIHGHVKVAPDGTVYLPHFDCNGHQGVSVSTDGGTTWTVRQVTGSAPPSSGILDPSVGIASDGTVYFAYVGKAPDSTTDNHIYVSVTKDRGVTWSASVDIGAGLGIKNAVFPAAVAGDPERAAVAFIGTTTGGDHEAADFKGTWYGFVAHTYDGGQTWKVVNASGGPVQREACIWNEGGNNACRNLLDFNDATVDDKGKVLFAYADGCIDGCETGGPNTYSSKATIARQSGGRGVFKQFDTPEPVAPVRPWLSGQRDDQAAYLSWIAPDNGGSAITAYKIFRGTSAGSEVLIGQTGGDDRNYVDRGVDASVASYTYKITAVNGVGESQPSNTVSLTVGKRVEFTGSCSLPGVTAISDPVGDETDTLPQHDITAVKMAELKDNDATGAASKIQ